MTSHASFARVGSAVLGFLFLALIIPALAFADGSQSYTTPGTYTFTVPSYGTLTVTVNGAGGGGGGGAANCLAPNEEYYCGANGGGGGNSSFNGSLVGYGGLGGGGGGNGNNTNGSNGGPGGASGGNISNAAGAGAGGGSGGSAFFDYGRVFGSGGSGGAGGQAVATYGADLAGDNVTVIVGAGGEGGSGGYDPYTGDGSSGGTGSVSITWTSPSAPTCSVSISPNPATYAYVGTPVALSWSSTNADDVYINNIGWVGTSGSTQVASQVSTDYSCYGWSSAYGAGLWNAASLTVTPPPSPAATIAASSTSMQAGQSTNVTADFSAGSGDQLTADNIDSPAGTGLGADTDPDPSKTIAFSTTTPGTYTFYARATTDYYTSWLTLASTTVIVTNPPPSCSLTASPSSITQGQSSTLTWSCTNATSCTGTNFNTGGATSGTAQVSPSQTTAYAGSCAGPGGTSNFSGNSEVTVSCQESWSCDGNTIVQTNADCSTTNVATCNAPEYCQSGSEICLAPQISFNASGNYAGHLQVVPDLVQSGETTQIHWNVSDAQSCAVTGTNGDSWTELASPDDGETSRPITAQTTYTLFCEAYDNNPNVTETQTVNIAPTYQEL